MLVVTPSRLTGPAALIIALAALAGCSNSGNGVAAGETSASAQPSTVASVPAMPSTPAKPSAAPASMSAKPSTPAEPSTPAMPSTATATVAATATARTPSAAASTPRAAQTPSALLDSALSAMLAQGSVHLDCTLPASTGGGSQSEDIGAASGRIVTTAGAVSISSLLVGGVVYFSTNTAGVLAANGISQAEAAKLAGKWISMRPGESYKNGYLSYTVGLRGMTLASQADALRLTGPLTRTAAMTVQGVAVYGVSGGVTFYYSTPANGAKGPTETVDIAAGGAPLPVRVSADSANGGATNCSLGSWNEPLDLTAPANAVPITSIPGN